MQLSTTDPEMRRHSSKSKSNKRLALFLTLLSLTVIIVVVIILTVVITKYDLTNNEPMPIVTSEYKVAAEKIIKYSTGPGSGKAYDWMANVSDLFGPRKIGSDALERAIDYSVQDLTGVFGSEHVHTEQVPLPRWVRGEETAYVISPIVKRLAILGLGSTVGTNGENLTAEVIVVTSWDDLHSRCASATTNQTGDEGVAGKIVLYNAPWDGTYGTASKYRTAGASEASKCGAVAAIIRSASSFSVYSPHTGQQYYADGVGKIPALSVAPEDADVMERLQRLLKPNEKLIVTILMSSYNDEANPIISRNVVFELPGSSSPNEMVMLSGHFDSWDVGRGAMDNGAGASVAMRAIVNLKELITRHELPPPKRTIRGIFWTAEEPGMLGSGHYYRQHRNDSTGKYVFLQEADEGFFQPLFLGFSGSDPAMMTFREQIFPLISGLKVTLRSGSLGDADWWANGEGVPGVMMASGGDGYQRYFTFHHSNGDTPSVYARRDLDAPTAIWAVLAYVIADMNQTLPISGHQ